MYNHMKTLNFDDFKSKEGTYDDISCSILTCFP